MFSKNEYSILELKQKSCFANYKYYKSLLENRTKLLVLIKANAYGHGATQFSAMIQGFGADYLAVAMPIEGIELRKSGISLPIIVLTSGTDFFEELIEYKLEPAIPNLDTLKAFETVLKNKNIVHYPIHIKLDTGMHRLGFVDDELDNLISYIYENKHFKIISIYSHLSCSEDPTKDDFTRGQIFSFKQMADKISNAISYKPMYHILNSAGIERFTEYQFDMVRLGLGIYGITTSKEIELQQVASLKCRILQIKDIEEGGIGYGQASIIAKPRRIATIPVGYADGIDRRLGCGNFSFYLNGHRVPTIGNICMDMTMLDITGVSAEVGDYVTIFGEELSVLELANALKTIPYEIFTSIPSRIKRKII